MKDKFGLFRVAAASPLVKVGDVRRNIDEMIRYIDKARAKEVSLLVFPELSVTAYTCGDLFGESALIQKAEEGVRDLVEATKGSRMAVVAGAPVRYLGRLYNCALFIKDGFIEGMVPKIYLPTYSEFYEARWFASGADLYGRDEMISYAGQTFPFSPSLLFKNGEATVGIEICEDLWTPIPPSSYHALSGAQVIVNLSASNEVLGKHAYRRSLVQNQSARTTSAYVYCSCGYGESTQDIVFAGSSLICEYGSILAESERFSYQGSMITADVDIDRLDILRQRSTSHELTAPDGTRSYRSSYSEIETEDDCDTDFEAELLRYVEPHPFVPQGDKEELDRRCREITSIQVTGLMSRLSHIRCKSAVIGISGGLDSTLALLITVLAFDRLGIPRSGIVGVTMPGFGTTDRTYTNAMDLMESLGITIREIPIAAAVTQHFQDIGHDPSVHDVTYENCQARERTQILMDIANQTGGIVVGTGDLSELALGWATYNGDHMSMYGVNASVPKTLVRTLVAWAADNHFKETATDGRSSMEILLDIIDTPISPELIPADENGQIKQKTEDLVGPYELHDFFLYNFFRCGYKPSKIYFLARKAFKGVYDDQTIGKWLRTFIWRFFAQQFKRSCLPDGPKVGSVSLSPRGDWRMPSDASSALWLEELDEALGN